MRHGTLGSVLVVLSASVSFAAPPPASGPSDAVVIDLKQSFRAQPIFPGQATIGWSYTGKVVSGSKHAVTPVPNSYLGPILSFNTDQDVTIRLNNQIGEDSVTHWHGVDVPADMDGYPTAMFPSGTTYTYKFTVRNRAGTYWYHPHTDMRTAEQAFAGLAGYFIVHDKEEQRLNLPSGAQDLPVCLQDTTFDANNQRVYDPDMINGYFGSTILVNGWPNYTHPTATRAYRLRVLNGSVSRIYKLAFDDGTPMTAIGTDGGLLDIPRTYPYIMLSPGERVELWADFRNKPIGSVVTLKSLAFSNSGGQGAPLDLMRFSIDRAEVETKTLPATLSTIVPYRLQDAVNAASPKTYGIGITTMDGMPAFMLNNGLFEPGVVAPNEAARCNTLEVIRVINPPGTAMIPHPIHFHGRSFQMLDRVINPGTASIYNTVKDGLIMHGWKDTYLIMPGETVRILVKHSAYPGMYVYHCHNLVHEDMNMMRNFQLLP